MFSTVADSYLRFPYLHFPPLHIRTYVFRTCIFHPQVLSFSVLAFSVAPRERVVCDGLVVSDDWSVPSLLVASNNSILRLVPDAVGTRSYELLASYAELVTALAAMTAERTVFFAVRGASTAFIGRFRLTNPSNL